MSVRTSGFLPRIPSTGGPNTFAAAPLLPPVEVGAGMWWWWWTPGLPQQRKEIRWALVELKQESLANRAFAV